MNVDRKVFFLIRNWLTHLWRQASPKICRVSWRAGTHKSQWCSCSPKAGRLETQELLMFQFESKGRKKLMSQSKGHQAGRTLSYLRGITTFSFYSGHQVIGRGPPTLGRGIYFTQSIDLNIHLIQNHLHRNTQYNVQPNNWAPHGQASGHIRLTTTDHHHPDFRTPHETMVSKIKHPSLFPRPQLPRSS